MIFSQWFMPPLWRYCLIMLYTRFMRCPHCQAEDTQVKDSRPSEGGGVVRRRRNCIRCQARFTTFERVHIPELSVLKKGGRKVSFDREKLARSIRIALRKRPIAPEDVERMIAELLNRIEGLGKSVIESARIGQMAMDMLQQIDAVAYVRFASVYKDFREPGDFRDFVKRLRPPETR